MSGRAWLPVFLTSQLALREFDDPLEFHASRQVKFMAFTAPHHRGELGTDSCEHRWPIVRHRVDGD